MAVFVLLGRAFSVLCTNKKNDSGQLNTEPEICLSKIPLIPSARSTFSSLFILGRIFMQHHCSAHFKENSLKKSAFDDSGYFQYKQSFVLRFAERLNCSKYEQRVSERR